MFLSNINLLFTLPLSNFYVRAIWQGLFFVQYILIIFFLLPLSRFFPPPYLPNFMFSPSKKKRKRRKKIKQIKNTVRQNMCVHTYTQSHPHVGQLPWMMPALPSVSLLLEKRNVPFPSMYQLQTASWFRIGLGVCVPFSTLGFRLVWTCGGLCVVSRVSTSSYAYHLCRAWKMLVLSLELSTTSGSWTLSISST